MILSNNRYHLLGEASWRDMGQIQAVLLQEHHNVRRHQKELHNEPEERFAHQALQGGAFKQGQGQ